MLCSFVRRIVVATVAAMLATSTVANAQPTIEQVNQALDLAEKAARHGMTDLSMRAVTRSLRFGPPTVSTAAPVKPLRQFGVRVDTSRKLPPTAVELIGQRIPSAVSHLADVWGRSADPSVVYAVIRDVVFPSQRPTQIFLYKQPFKLDPLDPEPIPPVNGLVDSLLQWAEKTDQFEDLRKHLDNPDREHSVSAMAVGVLIGLKLKDSNLIQKHADAILQLAAAGMNRQTAEFLASVGSKMRREGQSRTVAAKLLESAGSVLTKIDQLENPKDSFGPTVLLLAARCWFSAGDSKKGVSVLREYLGDAVESESMSNANTRKIDIVGQELFSRGLAKEGRELLGPTHSSYFERRYQFSVGSSDSGIDWAPPSELTEQRIARAVPSSDTTLNEEVAGQIWLCSLDLSSGKSKRLFALPDFQHAASPTVSPDGSTLCFEASFPGEAITSGSRIYVMDIASGKMRCLGSGTLPSWSPAGKRIVFSSFLPTRGVWITKLSAGDSQLIDRKGWAATWSPNGNMIAYSRNIGRDSDLFVFDIVENEYFSVFGDKPCPFSAINSGFQWAPDSKSLLLKTSSRELVEVPVLGLRSLQVTKVNFDLRDQFAWHATGGIVAQGKSSKDSPEQLVRLDNLRQKKLTVIPGQLSDRRNTGAAWMPDGDSLLYISKPARK